MSQHFLERAGLASSLLLAAAVADAAQDVRGNEPWPGTTTVAPSVAAWQAATPLRFERASGAHARSCELKRIAEWVNVRCRGLRTAAITQLGGNRGDVSYFIEPAGADRVPGPGQVTFSVRRGDRRVFLFWTLGPGYDGPLTVVPAVVLQESWSMDRPQPSLTLNDALHEPVATKTHPRAPQVKER